MKKRVNWEQKNTLMSESRSEEREMSGAHMSNYIAAQCLA